VPAERRRLIAERIEGAGSITVAALELEFGVSPMTARRDLQALEEAGLARRTHGGAVLPSLAGHEDSFQHRLEQASSEKARLAEAAVGLIAAGETVFVDSSTTAYFAARELVEAGVPATLVTNSAPVIDLVARADRRHVELVAVGGSLRRLTRSFVGPQAVAAIRAYFADKLLLSVKGVAPGGLLTDPDPLEAEVKRAMIEQAGEPMLLVDGSKFEGAGLHVIAPAGELALALAADAPAAGLAELSEAGVAVRSV
jgi:DeoR/GlpR family transcriptional regulator of sugar metabolism